MNAFAGGARKLPCTMFKKAPQKRGRLKSVPHACHVFWRPVVRNGRRVLGSRRHASKPDAERRRGATRLVYEEPTVCIVDKTGAIRCEMNVVAQPDVSELASS